MQPATPPLEVTPDELEALLETVREALGEAGYQKLKAAIRTLSYVTELLETREATLASLRRLLCRRRSERTEEVLEQAGIPRSPTPREPSTEVGSKKPGHGRKGAKAYPGAQRIEVPHATLYRGDRCPGCQRGKVYPLSEPGLLVRLRGQAPIAATVYELEKLRCNLCGEVFTAEAPAGVGQEKYDPTTASMIALLRYGSGFPWNRLADLEESLGVPLPVATQCEIVAEAAATLQPAMEELIRQAAQGAVLHNDDTSMPVLALRRNAGQVDTDDAASDAAERTGVFTSGIVSTAQKQTIALFFTGRQHAGENLADVLRQRAAELAPPLQMCDALSRNLPKLPEKLEVIVGHCLAHARRRFVEVIENFPQPCQHVLEQLGTVYGNDATAAPTSDDAGGTLALPPAAQRPRAGRSPRLAEHSVRGEESRTELGSGNGDALSAQALGAAHAVPAAAGSAARQQHCRKSVEESHLAPQELAVLQDREWSAGRRSVHEPDSHLRAFGRQPLRLPDSVTAPRRRSSPQPAAVDAVELPSHAGVMRRPSRLRLE